MSGVRRYKDLDAWNLAHEVEVRVAALIATSPAKHDCDFCDDIRRSSRSASRNISEGFGRFYPRDFAKFVRNALGSLHETQDHLDSGFESGYLSSTLLKELTALTDRAIGASVKLARYLASDDAKRRFDRIGKQPRARTTRKREL